MIKLERGLWQGDPLSPYFFLLVIEGLHALFTKAETAGELRGVSICAIGPRISHLLFADDSFIFCRAFITDCQKIQEILLAYEQASGQNINRGKTSLFFNFNNLKVWAIPRSPVTYKASKKEILQHHKRKDMEKAKGLEGKTPFPSWAWNSYQSGHPSNSDIHDVMLQTPKMPPKGNRRLN